MPRYEVVKARRGATFSHWNGDKKTGSRTKLRLGAIVDLPEEVAAKYGPALVRVDAGARKSGTDVPAPEEPSQLTPPIATRTVGAPAPTGDQAAPMRVVDHADQEITDDDAEGLLEGSANDVIGAVAAMDDANQLKKLKVNEKKGKDRVTVIAAIDARLGDLKTASAGTSST